MKSDQLRRISVGQFVWFYNTRVGNWVENTTDETGKSMDRRHDFLRSFSIILSVIRFRVFLGTVLESYENN